MNFFVFAVVVLIAIQEAYAIRCYKCQPDYASFVSAANKGNFSGLNLCNNPNATVDCRYLADACYTTSVGLAYNISLLNLNLQGEIKYYTLDCAVKSQGSQLKKTVCDNVTSLFTGMPAGIGFNISQCDVSCCQGDGCNNPSGPPGLPATCPSGPPATTTIYHTTPSSVKSTHVPPNAAIFGILGLVTMAFVGYF